MLKKINRIVSIIIALLITFVLIAALGYFIIAQVSLFSNSFSEVREKFGTLSNDGLQWVADAFHVDKSEIQAWIFSSEKGIDGMLLLEGIMEALKEMLVIFVLPVFTFIILYYKPLFLEFISELFKKREQVVVSDVLIETKTLI